MNAEKRERIRNALVSFAKKEFKMNATQQQDNSIVNTDEVNLNLVAPISPTPISLINEIMPYLKLDSSSRVIELGCGDGRWILSLAKQTNCVYIGIEIDQERLKLARRHKKECIEGGELCDSSVSFLSVDIFNYLENIDVQGGQDLIIMYLFREAMARVSVLLKNKGLATSLSNAKEENSIIQVLCIGFKLPGFTPTWQSKVEGIRAYLYHTEKQ